MKFRVSARWTASLEAVGDAHPGHGAGDVGGVVLGFAPEAGPAYMGAEAQRALVAVADHPTGDADGAVAEAVGTAATLEHQVGHPADGNESPSGDAAELETRLVIVGFLLLEERTANLVFDIDARILIIGRCGVAGRR